MILFSTKMLRAAWQHSALVMQQADRDAQRCRQDRMVLTPGKIKHMLGQMQEPMETALEHDRLQPLPDLLTRTEAAHVLPQRSCVEACCSPSSMVVSGLQVNTERLFMTSATFSGF